MKPATLIALLFILSLPAHADDTAAGLAAVTELGLLNGRALACGDKETSARAKSLMLLHAPRTPRYGAAFEQATQQGFLSQLKAPTACPAALAFAADADLMAKTLREKLPPSEPR